MGVDRTGEIKFLSVQKQFEMYSILEKERIIHKYTLVTCQLLTMIINHTV